MNPNFEKYALALTKHCRETGSEYDKLITETDGTTVIILRDGTKMSPDFLDDIGDEALREQRWKEVRGERGWRLRNCDWTQGADSPLTSAQKTAWRTYRQALRDITNQDDPEKINWPTPPA